MAQTKNPAPGKAQGFGIGSVSRKDAYTVAPHSHQPEFDACAWIAARARVAVPTARLHSELFGIGGAHG